MSRWELVPMSLELTNNQQELMLALNKVITGLFDAPGEDKKGKWDSGDGLTPSQGLNGEWYPRLSTIRRNPNHPVYYSLYDLQDSYCSHIWLNVRLNLGVYDSFSNVWGVVSLTPYQSYWVIKQLPEKFQNQVLNIVKSYAQRQAQKLRESADEIETFLSGDLLGGINRQNKVFDIEPNTYSTSIIRDWHKS